MRTLHLDTGREMRGGQWQVLRLIAGLVRNGVEAVLLARAGGALLAKAREWRLDARPLGLYRLAIESGRADLVHAHDARAHTLAALFGRAPLVVSRRVAFPAGNRWKYRRAARYVAVSRFVRDVLIAGGIPAEKISVVYDGVPEPECSWTGRGAALLAPAGADPMKGSDLAREAAALAGVPLEFAGILGSNLADAAAFLYLTRSEGLGSGVLLAMAAGVPVIASKTGGLPEIVEHRVSGLLVENRVPEIAGAIREVARDRALAEQLSAAGRKSVAERFTVDLMVDGTISAYRQVLGC